MIQQKVLKHWSLVELELHFFWRVVDDATCIIVFPGLDIVLQARLSGVGEAVSDFIVTNSTIVIAVHPSCAATSIS